MPFEIFYTYLFPISLIVLLLIVFIISETHDSEYKKELRIIMTVIYLDIIILGIVYPHVKNDENYNMWLITLSLYTPSIATIFGGIAYLNYRRKSGINIKGNFTIDKYNNKNFISEINLHSEKDKAITIYAIDLLVRYKIFNYKYFKMYLPFTQQRIRIKNYPINEPLKIAAFESIKISLQPIFKYSSEFILSNNKSDYKIQCITPLGKTNLSPFNLQKFLETEHIKALRTENINENHLPENSEFIIFFKSETSHFLPKFYVQITETGFTITHSTMDKRIILRQTIDSVHLPEEFIVKLTNISDETQSNFRKILINKYLELCNANNTNPSDMHLIQKAYIQKIKLI